MRRVRIRLPAAATDLGVGLHGLALALNLYTQVEITERSDDQLIAETSGEDTGYYALGLRHPVVVGMTRVFQQLERTAPGLTVRIDSQVPIAARLGTEAAFTLAGMIGANNLFGNPLSRQQIVQHAARLHRPDQVFAVLNGGLTTSVLSGETVLTKSLSTSGFHLVLMLPAAKADNTSAAVPERITAADALHNLSLLPLLIEALRIGDPALLAAAMDDRILAPVRRKRLPYYEDIIDFARRWGMCAVTFVGDGGALLFFAERDAEKLADALTAYCDDEAIEARIWTPAVDTQGIVVSMAQSS